MPVVLRIEPAHRACASGQRIGPDTFFFYSLENDEPPHNHIRRDRNLVKFWLTCGRSHSIGVTAPLSALVPTVRPHYGKPKNSSQTVERLLLRGFRVGAKTMGRERRSRPIVQVVEGS